jgi:hypothetical protein
MSSDEKSSVGESFVQRPRIIKVAAYLGKNLLGNSLMEE